MGAAALASERSAPSPPPLDTLSKPYVNRGTPAPGLRTRHSEEEVEPPSMPSPPPQPQRSPTPPTPIIEAEEDSGSPIRVAMPVSRGEAADVEDASEEQFSPPPAMPTRSLAQLASHESDLDEESSGYDTARGAGQAAAATSFGHDTMHEAANTSHNNSKRAIVQYDYEKAEDNELELREGEQITNIEMVDDDWWMGENPRGETGLFPSNYVELVDGGGDVEHAAALEPAVKAIPSSAGSANHPVLGPTATALYDYEAAEDNELSFPENAKITDLVRTFILTLS